jgi:hypothetical protein
LAVELAVGAVLVAATVLALVAGGTVRETASTDTAEPGASGASSLVLQCPLGVHRLPAPTLRR